MKCPACGAKDAYIGQFTSNIDCLNPSCKHFQGNATVAPAPTIAVPTNAAPSSPPATPPAMPWGNSASPNPIVAPATIATVSVGILSAIRKLKSVEITFMAYGDPGNPTHQVEFYWSLPGQAKVLCTLSNRSRYYVSGVDADGQTSYVTQWCCVLDGVQPNDPWTLEAVIN